MNVCLPSHLFLGDCRRLAERWEGGVQLAELLEKLFEFQLLLTVLADDPVVVLNKMISQGVPLLLVRWPDGVRRILSPPSRYFWKAS